jgi:hypothetical protein
MSFAKTDNDIKQVNTAIDKIFLNIGSPFYIVIKF